MTAPLSIREFSVRAGIDPRTTKKYIAAGKIPVIRLSERIVRIPGDVAERILTQGFPSEGVPTR